MHPVSPLAAFTNLVGLDGIIILAVQLLIFGGSAAAVLFIVRRSATWQGRGTTADRLEKLETLRKRGKISEAEHGEARRRILGQL